ncbi:ABC transporter permease subunit [Clostridium sp. BJN0013]|uniref:ABC transporter permease subunit n=1 Tax=Clostridium sp. BJN0013 TaxID=3236840 RepID=UPI0034C64864
MTSLLILSLLLFILLLFLFYLSNLLLHCFQTHPNIKLTNKNLSTKERQNTSNEIEELKITINNLKSLNTAQGDDWKNILHKNVLDLEKLKNKIPKNNITHINSINSKIDMDKYYINHDINPNDYNYTFNATKYISEIFSFLNMLFLSLIVVLGCSDIVSGENNPPTIKVLLTKPISRGKILFSKFIASIISIVLSLLICEFLSFVIIGITFKFGNLLSPIAVGFNFKHMDGVQNIIEKGGSSHIIPMWQFIVEVLLLQILFIIACASLSTLISVFFKSSAVSISVNFVVVTILTFTNFLMLTNSGNTPQSSFMLKILPFLFTTYSNGVMLLTGNINRFTGIAFINVKISIFVLIAWTIVCYTIAHFKFTNQDVFA